MRPATSACDRRGSSVRYTAGVPLAIVTFDFDPLVRLGDRVVRWETVAIAGAVLLALVVAGVLAGRAGLPADPDDPSARERHLRRDDLLLIVVGIVPGAVIGGRIAYVIQHLDYYRSNGQAALDITSGGLALSGAVLLGALTGGLVARLFDAPLGRWYRLAVVPMLLVLGLGKAAMVLGGSGQGLPSVLDWATRYLGPGPWGSLGPAVPSHPSQAYEAVGVLVVVGVLGLARLLGAFGRADGRVFAVGLGLWATVRLVVAGTWRDAPLIGGLNGEQLLDLAIVALALAVYLGIQRWGSRRREALPAPDGTGSGLAWPDPDTRHPF